MDAKKYFKIGELSKLYNIGLDSIRYYEEVGILKPIRDPKNNYRLYTLKDIRKMTMIRELLNLNFSLEQIKDFEEHRDIKHSVDLLEQELTIINDSIVKLLQTKNNIQSRLLTLHKAAHEKEQQGIRVMNFHQRPCIMISETNLPDAYVDYEIIKYTRSHPDTAIATIGTCDCYTLDLENSNPASNQYRTKNVFFYSEEFAGKNNYSLPSGKYLCVTYTGSYDQTKKWVPKMFDYAKEHGMDIISDPIEFCYVNEYETAIQDEYVTEVQIQVE